MLSEDFIFLFFASVETVIWDSVLFMLRKAMLLRLHQRRDVILAS